MLNLNMNRLGEEIHRLRKHYKMSQKDLAKGICSQAAISKIESGECFPSIDTIYLISIKLRVEVTYFISLLIQERNGYVATTIDMIEKLSSDKKYDEIFEITKFERLNNLKQYGYQYEQFISWYYHLSSYYLDFVPYLEVINNLQQLLSTKNLLDQDNYQDLKIQNSIAAIYAENNDYANSYSYYKSILSNTIHIDSFQKFRIKVMYNLSKVYTLDQKYNEALIVIDNAIDSCLKLESFYILGQLYYQKGVCQEKTNFDLYEISSNYNKAIFIFELTNQKSYVQHIQEKKVDFLKDSYRELNF
ncbi:helix-turn-helix domain-containing protein [Fictibacillus norfolkensis]|uniref:Helix-turn-helix domain-containing protein n=1 Tax=Fictibacillus norfolkensis TaxID=2762233 RepID=A0ABR8SN15_9BACL|nr:helix-turn-helix domain-containing protein [Fictibacillus norfolkensis]MBD7964856.1 helix-turn-helix domain-containing protein [Fictibacillus norfolkensis]